MALHAIPLKVAIRFDIPLIVWGENSAFEYGSDDINLKGEEISAEWLRNFAVTGGTTAEDWVDSDLTIRDLEPYVWDTSRLGQELGLQAVFLGHYFRWDPVETHKVAQRVGFQEDSKPVTGFYRFADIDDDFLMTVHHWMKWYKFGFTRLWDNLSIEIRNKRMSRREALNIIRATGGERPHEAISMFCDYLNMSIQKFDAICEEFRSSTIWHQDDGVWKIRNFPISDWNWKAG
jgi:hypothetical protein